MSCKLQHGSLTWITGNSSSYAGAGLTLVCCTLCFRIPWELLLGGADSKTDLRLANLSSTLNTTSKLAGRRLSSSSSESSNEQLNFKIWNKNTIADFYKNLSPTKISDLERFSLLALCNNCPYWPMTLRAPRFLHSFLPQRVHPHPC